MEYCPNGSLYDILNLKKDEFNLSWEKLFKWAIQV